MNHGNRTTDKQQSHEPHSQQVISPIDVDLLKSLSLEDLPNRLDESGPLFIMGCPRSGTTVLADCISTIPEIILRIGILMPDRMMHILGSRILDATAEEHILWSQRYVLWRSFLDAYLSRMTAVQDALRSGIVRTLWRRRLDPSELLFAYKEPFLVFGADKLAAHFPKCKFINIIRDGRDCADSMVRTYPHALVDEVLHDPLLWRLKGSEIGISRPWRGWQMPWWLPEGAEEEFVRLRPFSRAVFMWQIMVRTSQRLGRSLPSERYLDIRYEEFCKNPEEIGGQLLAFIGRSSSRPFRRVLRAMNSRSVGCHKRHGPELIREANRVGSPLLAELGYDSGQPS